MLFPQRRVLIIDEDRRTVDELQETFLRSGYEAEVALSPPVGLSIISERHMSIAILSARLGAAKNWKLVKKLKESDGNLPVLLFDGTELKGRSREARRAGVTKLLVKPFDAGNVVMETQKVIRN